MRDGQDDEQATEVETVLNVNINNVHSYRSNIGIRGCGKSGQGSEDLE